MVHRRVYCNFKQAIGNALLPDLEAAKENFLKEYPGAKITNMLEKSVPRNEASTGFAPSSSHANAVARITSPRVSFIRTVSR
jgi:hypothetical protein